MPLSLLLQEPKVSSHPQNFQTFGGKGKVFPPLIKCHECHIPQREYQEECENDQDRNEEEDGGKGYGKLILINLMPQEGG